MASLVLVREIMSKDVKVVRTDTTAQESGDDEQVRHKLNNSRSRRKTSWHYNSPRHSGEAGGTVFGTGSLNSQTYHDQSADNYKRISHHRGSCQTHGKKENQDTTSHGQQ